MNSHYRRFQNKTPLQSQAKAIARRREEEKAQRFRRMLAISVMAALTLGAIMLAKAESWVTVNPDGSLTRTEVRSQPAQTPVTSNSSRTNSQSNVQHADTYPDEAYGTFGEYHGPNSTIGVALPSPSENNTTFFAGTYYPVPSYTYTYQTPGYSYPVGPVIPRVTPPMVTTLPSTGVAYGYGYGAPYPYPPVAPYPYPVYVYPNYPTSSVYYSGPAGGGGTIYSSSTTTNNGYGITLGNRGLKFNIGNGTTSTESTTTIITTAPRY